ncbi:glutamine-fructose-6-phosphate aminotransferase [Paratrimastix pyriformis]|uniref:glutamine--fructose-6-phosphate transaminase (isomerizing) n=1 Tax=Paratrimastix pyriformis TaxID=342808 RepID=A0ABQ8UDD4_9EUKA|nr:glutamine-fructose-6-phosphate aminotransferase [Paratrimastix pyriformis]|eukprot:GAFH01001014.1.p1 GENE.GAFH01001014.1~~GAFH01001014.1.p1  ORF type:complete len:626 (-),score=116.38 GAFH01001014.1:207-2084(-)
MCGIILYLGARPVLQVLVEALHHLEYRGYDSAGIGFISQDQSSAIIKTVGTVDNLEAEVNRQAHNYETPEKKPVFGVGHTRWPTSGAATQLNAQPLFSNDRQWMAVLNGIVENKDELVSELTSKGYHFESENDAEVIPVLMEHFYKQENDTLTAFVQMLSKLQGAYAVAVLHATEQVVYCARLGSPMCIGVADGERFVSSDPVSFRKWTDQVIHLEDREIALITSTSHQLYRIRHNYPSVDPLSPARPSAMQGRTIHIPMDLADVEKGSYAHFMLKEIYQQPKCIGQTFVGKIANLDAIHIDIPNPMRQLVFVACGTSHHASMVGRYLVEQHAQIQVIPEYASEFIYRTCLLGPSDLVIAVSQSGETADTREALHTAIRAGAKTAGIVNVVGSQIARMAGQGMYLHAGPEIGVASTKAFTCQVTAMILLAAFLSKDPAFRADVIRTLPMVPPAMDQLLHNGHMHATIDRIVDAFKGATNALYLGRGMDYPVALEGALKLKEISYIHAEGYPAGEMKHGPIALVDTHMPVFFVLSRDAVLFPKVLINMEEVRTRGGRIITITDVADPLPTAVERVSEFLIRVPYIAPYTSPLLKVIPLQLISYRIAVAKGLNPDRPRNLAKSVTVE